ncbi:MAG: hypothetical protein SWY16_17795 [Cyanobacteriota bacterium]|nr:hypothetical protein [Cyanobacteriota bacterium]
MEDGETRRRGDGEKRGNFVFQAPEASQAPQAPEAPEAPEALFAMTYG